MQEQQSNLILPDDRLVGPDGRPVTPDGPDLVGINLYEAPNGDDSIALIAKIAALRERREKLATLVAAPGAITGAVITEVRLFNQEVFLGRELTELEEAVIRASVDRQLGKQARRAERHAKSLEGQAAAARGETSRRAKKKQAKRRSARKRRRKAT